MNNKNQIDRVRELIKHSDNIVFFGGAGMSTESGIPDFRSPTGLFSQKYKYPAETILSRSFFKRNPQEFYEFYRERILEYIIEAQPNKGHVKLAEWERQGKLQAVITQNIDSLHQKAGSENVLELHGCVMQNFCSQCGKAFDIQYILMTPGIACCDQCNGVIHPGIVLYEESLDEQILSKSIEYIAAADILIVAGTSMVVYPAAGLINFYRGNKLILIDKNPELINERANYIIHGLAGEILDLL